MRKLTLLGALSVLMLVGLPYAQQVNPALKAAGDALGVDQIKTLQFTGTGKQFTVGQNYTASEPWPPVTVNSYTASVNYRTESMRVELVREMGDRMPRGGGAPFTGEQRLIQVVSGNYAWNVPVPARAPAVPPTGRPGGGAPGTQVLPEGRAAAAGPPAVPAIANQVERLLALWATPQGFIKAAIANNATTKKTPGGMEVSFTVGGKYKMTGLINAQNRVQRGRTWIDQSPVGDMPVETTYAGYKDFGGVLFPAHISQKQDGFPSLDLTITSVMANSPVDIAVPDNVRNARVPPITVNAQKLADGVYYLTGGTHHSLSIEMKDYIVLVDVPNDETRAAAVLAKTKELIPGKPVRYVVTSHHHWDHLGGIRTAIDEGAIIVTHQSNRAFLERVATAPHTLNPDRLVASKKPLKIQTVGTKGMLTDGTPVVELHLMTNYEHTGDMLVGVLAEGEDVSGA